MLYLDTKYLDKIIEKIKIIFVHSIGSVSLGANVCTSGWLLGFVPLVFLYTTVNMIPHRSNTPKIVGIKNFFPCLNIPLPNYF